MVLLYSKASYRSRDGFKLLYFFYIKVWVWFCAIFLSLNITFNVEPLDARGASANIEVKYQSLGIRGVGRMVELKSFNR